MIFVAVPILQTSFSKLATWVFSNFARLSQRESWCRFQFFSRKTCETILFWIISSYQWQPPIRQQVRIKAMYQLVAQHGRGKINNFQTVFTNHCCHIASASLEIMDFPHFFYLQPPTCPARVKQSDRDHFFILKLYGKDSRISLFWDMSQDVLFACFLTHFLACFLPSKIACDPRS